MTDERTGLLASRDEDIGEGESPSQSLLQSPRDHNEQVEGRSSRFSSAFSSRRSLLKGRIAAVTMSLLLLVLFGGLVIS
jgi:hypothetical protein